MLGYIAGFSSGLMLLFFVCFISVHSDTFANLLLLFFLNDHFGLTTILKDSFTSWLSQ